MNRILRWTTTELYTARGSTRSVGKCILVSLPTKRIEGYGSVLNIIRT